MLYPSTAGIVFLKRLQRPDIGKTIEERSIRLLAEEERIKSDRAAYIKLLMGKGYSQEEATKKAYAKFGEGYFERQERITAEQNQRLYLEQNPPQESGGLFGGAGMWGIAAVVLITIVISVATYGAASALLGTALTALETAISAASATVQTAVMFAAEAAASAIAGAVSSFASSSVGQTLSTGKYDLGTALKAAGIGALMAAAAYGVGHTPGLEEFLAGGPKVLETAKETVTLNQITLKPVLHGLAQGGISTLGGGDFAQGFLSGMLSSATGPIINNLGLDSGIWGQVGRGIAGAAVGAGGALIVDGDVAMGAIQGAFVQMFNEFLANRKGKAVLVTERDGSVFNQEIYVGQFVKGKLYLSPEMGGGSVPEAYARDFIRTMPRVLGKMPMGMQKRSASSKRTPKSEEVRGE